MPVSSKNHQVPCRRCGFSFPVRPSRQPLSVFCPSCGDEFVYQPASVQEVRRGRTTDHEEFESPGTRKESPRKSGTESRSRRKMRSTGTNLSQHEEAAVASGRSEGRYGEILMIAVFVQFIVLAISPWLIMNYFGRLERNGAAEVRPSITSEPIGPTIGQSPKTPVVTGAVLDNVPKRDPAKPGTTVGAEFSATKESALTETPSKETGPWSTVLKASLETGIPQEPVVTEDVWQIVRKADHQTLGEKESTAKEEAACDPKPAQTAAEKSSTETAAPGTEATVSLDIKELTQSVLAEIERRNAIVKPVRETTINQEEKPVEKEIIAEQKLPEPVATVPSPQKESAALFVKPLEKTAAQQNLVQKDENKQEIKADTTAAEHAPEIVKELPVKQEQLKLPYEAQLEKARTRLAEAKNLVAIDPERGLGETIKAVRMFEELGQAIPASAYWIIGQAYAAQSWGESLIENSKPIENMAVSSDSRWLLSQCSDNTVWIWDLFRSQQTVDGFKLDSGVTTFVKLLFTPDFRMAIGGEADGTIRIWNTTLKNPADSVITLNDRMVGLRDLQVSPDGRWLVACGGPAQQSGQYGEYRGEKEVENAALLQMKSTKESLQMAADQPEQTEIAFKNDAATQQTAPSTLPMVLQQSSKVEGHEKGQIIQVSYQEQKATNSGKPNEHDTNIVCLWDLELIQKGVIPQPILLRGHEKAIRTMTISADSQWLVTGSDDATARIYHLKGAYPGADQAVLKGHQLGVTSVVISTKGNWVATGSRDNMIRLWSLPNSKNPAQTAILNGHLGWISALATDESGTRLISGSYDKTIRVWSIPDAQIQNAATTEPYAIPNDQGTIKKLLLTKDGKTLVSLGGDASLRLRGLAKHVRDMDSSHTILIRNRMLPITKIALTPDDRWLIFNYHNQRDSNNSGIRLWPLRQDEIIENSATFTE